MAYKPYKDEKDYFRVRTVWPAYISERLLQKKKEQKKTKKGKRG